MDDHNNEGENIATSLRQHRGPDPNPPAVSETDYKMDHEKRGKALIINNTFSKCKGITSRQGSTADCEAMRTLLGELGFEVQSVPDKDAAEMISLVTKVATETDFTNMDCFVCVVLSYGAPGYVYGLDARVEVDKLVQPFKGDKCQGLVGKPKLFFLQTCPLPPMNAQGVSGEEERKIPTESDLLIVQSCIPGKLTWNTDPTRPSLFIDALVNVIRNLRQQCDLLTMMTRLLNKLDSDLKGRKDSNGKLPHVSSTLCKCLDLN